MRGDGIAGSVEFLHAFINAVNIVIIIHPMEIPMQGIHLLIQEIAGWNGVHSGQRIGDYVGYNPMLEVIAVGLLEGIDTGIAELPVPAGQHPVAAG